MGSLPGEEARAKRPVLSEQVANIEANSKQASFFPLRGKWLESSVVGWGEDEARARAVVQKRGALGLRLVGRQFWYLCKHLMVSLPP